MKGMGVEQNMNSAVYWYQKAVEKSYEEAPYDIIYIVEAQYELGYMYKNGFGVEKSMSKSIYWYRKAAKKGHIYAKERLTEIGETW